MVNLSEVTFGFKWAEEMCQLNEDFIKSYNNDSDEENFLEVVV